MRFYRCDNCGHQNEVAYEGWAYIYSAEAKELHICCRCWAREFPELKEIYDKRMKNTREES